MEILKINNINKSYKSEGVTSNVLNGVTLSFPNVGLIGIIGKSGCGKSTLLNILASYEKPDDGEVVFGGRSINRMNKREVNEYRTKDIGFVFQHYNLLDNLTCVENIALPMMIYGKSKSQSFNDANTLLDSIEMPLKIRDKCVKDLSGGEKQRIGLLRALINDPKIVFCDEPTGALDTNNSKLVMKMLKKASAEKLIIVVSHNFKLIKNYADRIIEINEGTIVSDKETKQINLLPKQYSKVKFLKKKAWRNLLITNHFKRRKTKSVLECISLTVGLTSTLLSLGFIFGSQESIEKQTKCHLDYGVVTLSKEIKIGSGSGPSIIKTLRPTRSELKEISKGINDYTVCNNYDFLVPQSSQLTYLDKTIENSFMCPIYDFNEGVVDKSLLIEGRFPHDSLNECVINKQMKKYLVSEYGEWELEIKWTNESFYSHDFEEGHYEDTFKIDEKIHIVGVVDELDFLANKKAYYSFKKLDEYMDEKISENASEFYGEETTWKTIVDIADKNENISGYSYRLFSKNIIKNKLNKSTSFGQFKLTSNNYEISDALMQLIDTTKDGVAVFFLIVLIGTMLICGIINYSNFSEDRHDTAILFSLGCSFSDTIDLFSLKSLIVSSLSLIISVSFSMLIQRILNVIIETATGFKSVINIPWISLFDCSWLFTVILVVAVIAISIITSALPIAFSRRVSIKEELMDE